MNEQEKKAPQEEPSSPADASKRSIVDAVFDALTLRTAKGLVLVKDVFESTARWFDARAKRAGELAAKLSSPSSSSSESGTREASA
ncbi:MAG: hypothetical protein KIS78_33050 [Labilithrix sp.]|nr:hypothetical protein [Labilithrix sp.]MCW5837270.1 hypothetical protein [Labilithrix sp.]